ncbi:MAG: hypothetical protein PHC64_03640 [Candidatus Gastranaerophilales bacterium]|nr:hypothetical protein [Candidatus Gastranaerophilales bacterium]
MSIGIRPIGFKPFLQQTQTKKSNQSYSSQLQPLSVLNTDTISFTSATAADTEKLARKIAREGYREAKQFIAEMRRFTEAHTLEPSCRKRMVYDGGTRTKIKYNNDGSIAIVQNNDSTFGLIRFKPDGGVAHVEIRHKGNSQHNKPSHTFLMFHHSDDKITYRYSREVDGDKVMKVEADTHNSLLRFSREVDPTIIRRKIASEGRTALDGFIESVYNDPNIDLRAVPLEGMRYNLSGDDAGLARRVTKTSYGYHIQDTMAVSDSEKAGFYRILDLAPDGEAKFALVTNLAENLQATPGSRYADAYSYSYGFSRDGYEYIKRVNGQDVTVKANKENVYH